MIKQIREDERASERCCDVLSCVSMQVVLIKIRYFGIIGEIVVKKRVLKGGAHRSVILLGVTVRTELAVMGWTLFAKCPQQPQTASATSGLYIRKSVPGSPRPQNLTRQACNYS